MHTSPTQLGIRTTIVIFEIDFSNIMGMIRDPVSHVLFIHRLTVRLGTSRYNHISSRVVRIQRGLTRMAVQTGQTIQERAI